MYHKTVVPQNIKRIRDVVVSEPAVPVQAELIQDASSPKNGARSKRHRLIDPMAYEPLHRKLLAQIAARTGNASLVQYDSEDEE